MSPITIPPVGTVTPMFDNAALARSVAQIIPSGKTLGVFAAYTSAAGLQTGFAWRSASGVTLEADFARRLDGQTVYDIQCAWAI